LTATDLNELERLLYQSSELGDKADFERAFGPQKDLRLFIRSLVGLDRAAAQEAFGEFLDGSRYNGDQIRFVNLIIEHLTSNGVMDPARLYESPYTDANPIGLDGLFDDACAGRIVTIIHRINDAAMVAG
jgi:type I restriction enzyme R subunit